MAKIVWLLVILFRNELQNGEILIFYEEWGAVLFFGLWFSLWFGQVLLNPELHHSPNQV